MQYPLKGTLILMDGSGAKIRSREWSNLEPELNNRIIPCNFLKIPRILFAFVVVKVKCKSTSVFLLLGVLVL